MIQNFFDLLIFNYYYFYVTEILQKNVEIYTKQLDVMKQMLYNNKVDEKKSLIKDV